MMALSAWSGKACRGLIRGRHRFRTTEHVQNRRIERRPIQPIGMGSMPLRRMDGTINDRGIAEFRAWADGWFDKQYSAAIPT